MARKYFPANWISVYSDANESHEQNGYPMQTGGAQEFSTFIGYDWQGALAAFDNSQITPRVFISFYCINPGEVDYAMHEWESNPGNVGGVPLYGYPFYSINLPTAGREYEIEYVSGDNYGWAWGTRNSGYHGITLFGDGNFFTGNDFNLIIEGEWDTPPKAPVWGANSPAPNEVADDSVFIDWYDSTDNEQSASQLSYNIEYYNGSNWVESWSVGTGVSNYDYPLSGQAETTSARFRVRAYDGQYYSGWSYSPYFEVRHNVAPNNPTLTYPVGGERINESLTVQWNYNGDTDGDSLRVRIAYKEGDGDGINGGDENGGWSRYVTSYGATSHTFDTSNWIEGSLAQIAIRADDGYLSSVYIYGDIFTISHNDPPQTPTLLSPIGGVKKDRTQSIQFNWQHNDAGNQSKYEFRWREQGGTTWNNINQTTTNEYLIVTQNTFPFAKIEWQVKTYDQEGLASPWSGTGIFNAAEQTNAPEIIAPNQDEVIPTTETVLEWSSTDQDEFEIEVSNESGLVWSTSKQSQNKAITIGFGFTNNTQYVIRVRVRATGGIWSDWAEVIITTSFLQPPLPFIETETDNKRGSIRLNIFKPTPVDPEPTVTKNELFRRIGTDWIKLANNIPRNFYYEDYTPANSVEYEYKVIATGDNNTTIESEITHVSVAFKEAILAMALEPDMWIQLAMGAERSFDNRVARTQMQFNGRAYPISEFGQSSTSVADLTFKLIGQEQVKLLEAICTSRQPLLYRDSWGRRKFVTTNGLSITDVFNNIYEVSLSPNQIDFSEEVD